MKTKQKKTEFPATMRLAELLDEAIEHIEELIVLYEQMHPGRGYEPQVWGAKRWLEAR